MAGPVGLGQQGYVSYKSLRKNWRFVLCSTAIIGVILYFWAR
jgi:Sec-independent protein secretion pathway component TatC